MSENLTPQQSNNPATDAVAPAQNTPQATTPVASASTAPANSAAAPTAAPTTPGASPAAAPAGTRAPYVASTAPGAPAVTSAASAPQQNYISPAVSPAQTAPAPAAPTAKPVTPSPIGQQNVFSLLSVIFAFVFPIMGVVFGHIGLNQIKKTREPGRGLAITGLTVGYIFNVLAVIGFFIWIALLSALSYWTLGDAPHSMIHDLENF